MNGKNALDFEKPIVELEKKLSELKELASTYEIDLSNEIKILEAKVSEYIKSTFANLNRWEKVWLARHIKRPYSLDYIEALIENRIELYGDRLFADDPALVGGIGWFEGQPVVYIGQQKGRTTKERQARNFGMMHPEGYRKARRLMKLAEKFERPIISFVDTPAAHPGGAAEERGQAMSIAENLAFMANLETPIIALIVGEGGSGGALGIAVADLVLMLEYAIYCVCPPEACSGILWKDQGEHAPEAAECLKLAATDLLRFGIIDEIIEEPLGGAHSDPQEVILRVRKALKKHLTYLKKIDKQELIELRYQKYRKIGVYGEG
jgi:acetyl-CoA carboxylase carboxyl transferase subunit alpha